MTYWSIPHKDILPRAESLKKYNKDFVHISCEDALFLILDASYLFLN